MLTLEQTPDFRKWLGGLKDRVAQDRIALRLRRAMRGNLGDHKLLSGGLIEVRVDYGPGYRLYAVRRGEALIILLCGGDKRSQDRDIARARAMMKEV